MAILRTIRLLIYKSHLLLFKPKYEMGDREVRCLRQMADSVLQWLRQREDIVVHWLRQMAECCTVFKANGR